MRKGTVKRGRSREREVKEKRQGEVGERGRGKGR